MLNTKRVFFVVSALFVAQAATAYVPPSFYIVRTLARKHAAFNTGTLKHKLTFYKRGGEVDKTVTELVALNSDADKVSVRILSDSGNTIFTHQRSLSGKDGFRPILYDLVLFKNNDSMFEQFKAFGLPLKPENELYSEKEGSMPYKPEETVNFVRLENKVAAVVGVPPVRIDQAPRSAQLWVDKDSILPLRAIFPSSPQTSLSGDPLEFRFSSFQVYKNFLYPKTTQVYRGGALWVKIDTLELKPESSATLEAMTAQAEPDGDTREHLEKYFKWIR